MGWDSWILGAEWDGKDSYGRIDLWDDHKEHKPKLLRHTPAKFGDLDMLIKEPCNYASNVAYYHAVTRICSKENWSMDIDMVRA